MVERVVGAVMCRPIVESQRKIEDWPSPDKEVFQGRRPLLNIGILEDMVGVIKNESAGKTVGIS